MRKIHLKNLPLLWLSFGLITGIFLCKKCPLDEITLFYVLLFIGITVFIFRKKLNTNKHIFIPIWLTTSFVFGLAYGKINDPDAIYHSLKPIVGVQTSLIGTVKDIQIKEKYNQLTVELLKVKADSLLYETIDLSILVNLHKDSIFPSLYDKIVFAGTLNEIRPPPHQYAFNWRQYLHNRGIYFQTSIQAFKISKTEVSYLNNVHAFLKKTQTHIVNHMQSNFSDSTNFSIASALLVGYRDELNTDTKEKFSQSGAYHLLAISGLHIGILLLILNRFIKLLPFNNRFWLKYNSIITILILWFYIGVTGFSVSTVRSGAMFSVLMISQFINRPKLGLNSLSAVAIIILLFDVNSLYDVGFQMSFSAVFAIISILPSIDNFLQNRVRRGIKNYILMPICLTLVAQLTVTPIILYYFNQFSVWFILSGTLTIVLAYIALMIGALYLFSFLAGGSIFLAKLLEQVVAILYYLVELITCLPHSHISNIYFDWDDCMYFVIGVTCFCLYVVSKNNNWLIGACLLFMFSLINREQDLQELNNKELIVFHQTKEGIALDIIENRQKYMLRNISTMDQPDYSSKPLNTAYGIQNIKKLNWESNHLKWKNIEIVYYQNQYDLTNQKIDFLYIPPFYKVKKIEAFVLCNEIKNVIYSDNYISNFVKEQLQYIDVSNKVNLSEGSYFASI